METYPFRFGNIRSQRKLSYYMITFEIEIGGELNSIHFQPIDLVRDLVTYILL